MAMNPFGTFKNGAIHFSRINFFIQGFYLAFVIRMSVLYLPTFGRSSKPDEKEYAQLLRLVRVTILLLFSYIRVLNNLFCKQRWKKFFENLIFIENSLKDYPQRRRNLLFAVIICTFIVPITSCILTSLGNKKSVWTLVGLDLIIVTGETLYIQLVMMTWYIKTIYVQLRQYLLTICQNPISDEVIFARDIRKFGKMMRKMKSVVDNFNKIFGFLIVLVFAFCLTGIIQFLSDTLFTNSEVDYVKAYVELFIDPVSIFIICVCIVKEIWAKHIFLYSYVGIIISTLVSNAQDVSHDMNLL